MFMCVREKYQMIISEGVLPSCKVNRNVLLKYRMFKKFLYDRKQNIFYIYLQIVLYTTPFCIQRMSTV
jgi:hypothetical protein